MRVWDGILWRTEVVEFPDWLFGGSPTVEFVPSIFDPDDWTEDDALREALADDAIALPLIRVG